MSAELKVVEKIRKVLTADSVVKGYVKNRVYGTHVSTISQPQYPCISIHILNVNPYFSNREFYSLSLQIDIWLSGNNLDGEDLLVIADRFRVLLDRQDLTDFEVDIAVAMFREISAGPMMTEPNKNLIHYPLLFEAVIK